MSGPVPPRGPRFRQAACPKAAIGRRGGVRGGVRDRSERPSTLLAVIDRPDFGDQVLQTLERAPPDHRILGVWLHGSHARGEAAPRSDVDLAVLADRRIDPIALGMAATRLERLADGRVDPAGLRAASGLFRVMATHGGPAAFAERQNQRRNRTGVFDALLTFRVPDPDTRVSRSPRIQPVSKGANSEF